MANETERGGGGYLRACLADGARPFLYRSRVRALLGLPPTGGVTMNFPSRLPMAGFNYVTPRFAGEFDLPDNLFSSVSSFENRPTSSAGLGSLQTMTMPLSVEIHTLDRDADRLDVRRPDPSAASSAGLKDVQPTSQNGEVSREAALHGISTRSSPLPDKATLIGGSADRSRYQGQGKAGSPAAKREAASVQVPPTTLSADSVNASRGSNDTGDVKPRLVQVVLPPAAHDANRTAGMGSSFAATATTPLPYRELPPGRVPTEGSISRRTTSTTSPKDDLRTVARTSSEPRLTTQPLSPSSARTVMPKRPLVATAQFVSSDETAKPWEERGFPVRRTSHSEAKSGKQKVDSQYEPHRKAVPPAHPVAGPPQVVIVQQSGERSVSPAFWERRYLNRVRARVRQ